MGDAGDDPHSAPRSYTKLIETYGIGAPGD